MNRTQRIVLMAGFLVVLVAVLFPPWVFVYDFPGGYYYRAAVPSERAERPAGYHWLFGQHIPTDQTYLTWLFNLKADNVERNRLGFFALRVDSTRLGFEIGAAILLIGILYLALRSPKKDT